MPMRIRYMLAFLLLCPTLSAAGTLTPATGGGSIPSETVGGTFTELTGPVYDEANSGEVGTGSIVLQLPPGFEWDTSTSPVIRVTRLNPGFPGGQNINDLADGGTIPASSINSQQVTFQIAEESSAQRRNRITFENLAVRPQQVTPEASGDIVHMGTSNIDGVTAGSTSWGYLEQQPLQQDVFLTANGEADGPVVVEAGETVNLAVNVFNCPSGADYWRDRWTIDGTSDDVFSTDTACQRSLIERQETFGVAGTYTVTFESAYCSGWGCFFGNWTTHGSDSIVIEVTPGTSPSGQLFDLRMESETWDGTSGEVIDSSGNGHNGTTGFGATTDDTTPDSALTGDPGTCLYADLSGDSRIQVPRPAAVNDGESFTLAAWLHMPLGEQTLAQPSIIAIGDADPEYGERFEFYKNSNDELVARFTQVDGDVEDSLRTTGVFDGGWHHIAVTRHFRFVGNRANVDRVLYVDGVEVDSESEEYNPGQSSGAYLADATGDIHMAGFPGAQYPASARFDDVQMFMEALSATEISNLSQRRLPCGTGVDNYQITHPGTGITCASTPVTIEAYDADGNPVEPDAGTTVTLSSDLGGGYWSALLSGSGSFSSGPDGTAGYAFPGGETAFQVSYDYTAIGSDPMSVTPTAADGDGNGSVANPLTISRAGFRFIDRNTGNATIPFQIAGKPSDTGYSADDIGLQAVRENDDDPTTCEGVYADGATATVGLGAECHDPATCGGEQVTVNGTAIATSDDNGDSSSVSAYTDVNLTFGPNSTAPLSLNYMDVGEIDLYAAAQIERADGTDSGDVMTGSSNDFVWRPFGFHVDSLALTADGDPVGPSGAVFKAAGEDFDVTVTAKAWEAGDDNNNDGHPDAGSDLENNATTPAFGTESQQSVSVSLEPQVSAPAAGVDGNLSNASLTAFSNGTDQITTNWSEVGYVDLVAEIDAAYLGTEIVRGRGRDAGRFIPDRLEVDVVEAGSLATGCDIEFSYLRQDLAYAELPQIRITPVNTSGGHTQNYARFPGENWWRLPAIDPTYDDEAIPSVVAGDLLVDSGMADHTPETDHPENDSIGDNNRLLLELTGELAYQFASGSAPDVAPFDADFRMSIDLKDLDDVQYNNPNDSSETYVHEIAFNESAEQRHGRLNIGNAHGSELLDLEGVIQTETYRGQTVGWKREEDDVCTTGITLQSNVLDGGGSACLYESGGANNSGIGCGADGASRNWAEPPTVPNGGDFNAWFRAPGSVGSHRVGASVTPNELQYDWDGDGTGHNEDPSGRITFGIYEGHQRRIDLRETW